MDINEAVTQAGDDPQRLREKLSPKTGPIILAPPSDLLRHKCENCFATIGYAPRDVKRSFNDEGEYSCTLLCPNCNLFTQLRG